MLPDFNQKTIDTLAKRAAFKCSNPDCRVSTVGPNSDPKKSIIIGEAAHIFGARSSAKRYDFKMTDTARAEITNAIWLCRNCHKLVDTDAQKYSSEILFAWREQHEKYVHAALGSVADRIQFEQQNLRLSLFEKYPPLIRRIVTDKPDGWEWRLTAELMRYLNRPVFQKIDDLRNSLYIKPQGHIDSDDVIGWVRKRMSEAENIFAPAVSLIDRLNTSWGAPGEPGNVEEIHHICILIRDYLEQVVLYEEQIYFANVPDEYENLVDLIKDLIGSQAEKIAEIPDALDEVVSMIGADIGHEDEDPCVIEKTIEFNVPEGWEKKMNRELKKIGARSLHGSEEESIGTLSGLFIGLIVLWLIFSMF